MKSLFSRIILAITLTFGFSATSLATVYGFSQSDSIFTDSSYIIGGTNSDIDVFYFTNPVAGTYHYYSTGSTDVYGFIYSDTSLTTLASNDDINGSLNRNFCVEAYLNANEDISVVVTGYSASSTGSYGIVGSSGTCADSGYSYTDTNTAPPAEFDGAPSNVIEVSALSLPILLFSVLSLGAVRLRRFFA